MKKRLIAGFGCAVLLFVVMISTEGDLVQKVVPFFNVMPDDNDVSCYEEATAEDGFPYFENSLGLARAVPDRNIFFHETSCFSEYGIVLNARQACAVESAAKMNPTMMVYLLVLSPSRVSKGTKDRIKHLLTYDNVRIGRIVPETYTMNTPLESWYASGVLKKSEWPRSHMSDILRYLTLWKYGGIYLDLDVVITSSLENLRNFAGAEDWDDVAAGVMGFDQSPLGRRVATACIQDLKKNFRGDVWGNNGPGVITRTLQKICATKYARDMNRTRCQGFKVYPPSAFYPIHYRKWRKYFESKGANETLKQLKNSMGIHVWNKLSGSRVIDPKSNVPYSVIARKHCPKVFNSCKKQF